MEELKCLPISEACRTGTYGGNSTACTLATWRVRFRGNEPPRIRSLRNEHGREGSVVSCQRATMLLAASPHLSQFVRRTKDARESSYALVIGTGTFAGPILFSNPGWLVSTSEF